MKKLVIALLVVVLLGAAGAAAFLILRSKNASAVDTWIGKQIVKMASSYIEPTIDFASVRYTAPYHVEFKDATLTARDGTRVAQIGTLVLELAELPASGQPIKIKQITLESPTVNLIESKDGGFKGLVPFVRGTKETRQVEEDVKLSNVLRLDKVELRDGAITYQLADGSPPMSLSGLSLDLNIAKAGAGGSEGVWYDLDTSFGRAPQLTAVVKGAVNLDSMVARIATCDLAIDVDERTIQNLPPQVQTILREHDAKGAMKIGVVGTVPMMKAMDGDAELSVRVTDFNVAQGEYKFPISKGDIVVGLKEGVVNLRTFDLRTLGGAIGADGSARLKETGMPADLNWKLTDLEVRELLRAGAKPGEQPKLAGVLNGSGVVHTQLQDPKGTISGDGSIHLRDGRLVILPALRKLADMLSLGTKLLESSQLNHKADVTFSLSPKGVNVTQSEIDTGVIGARGTGVIGFDGMMDLKVNAGPMEKVQNLLGKAGKILGEVTDKVVKYWVHGEIGSPQVEVLPLGLGG